MTQILTDKEITVHKDNNFVLDRYGEYSKFYKFARDLESNILAKLSEGQDVVLVSYDHNADGKSCRIETYLPEGTKLYVHPSAELAALRAAVKRVISCAERSQALYERERDLYDQQSQQLAAEQAAHAATQAREQQLRDALQWLQLVFTDSTLSQERDPELWLPTVDAALALPNDRSALDAYIAELAESIVTAAERVVWKFGHDNDGVPSDWSEWIDLRDAIAAAKEK